MKNLISFSFLLILLPQLSFDNWQNKHLLTVYNNFKPEVIAIYTPKNYNSYSFGKKLNNNSRTNLLVQNQSNLAEDQKLINTVTNIKSTAEPLLQQFQIDGGYSLIYFNLKLDAQVPGS